MRNIDRCKRNLKRTEAEFDLIGAIIGGPSNPPNRFVYALLMSGLFLCGVHLTATHTLHDVPRETSLVVRLCGPFIMFASLFGAWMVFKRTKRPPRLLSEDETLPDFAAPRGPQN